VNENAQAYAASGGSGTAREQLSGIYGQPGKAHNTAAELIDPRRNDGKQ
jgi:hypothetical protein